MDLGDLFDFDLFNQIVSDTLVRDDIDGMLVVLNYNGVFFPETSRTLAGKNQRGMPGISETGGPLRGYQRRGVAAESKQPSGFSHVPGA